MKSLTNMMRDGSVEHEPSSRRSSMFSSAVNEMLNLIVDFRVSFEGYFVVVGDIVFFGNLTEL